MKEKYNTILVIVLFVFSVMLVQAQETDKEIWRKNYDKALQFYNAGDYKSALVFLDSTYDIAQKTYKENEWELEESIFLLGNTYKNLQQYDKSLPLLQKALALMEQNKWQDNPVYILRVNEMGRLYCLIGEYKKAIPFFEASLEIAARIYGVTHSYYAVYLNDLALTYKYVGDYEKAQPLFIESVDITEKNVGKNNASYLLSCYSLASFYQDTGEHKKALPIYIEAIEIVKKLGFDDYNYDTLKQGLGTLYRDMGEYEKSLPLLTEYIQITEKKFGKEYYNYGNSLNELALLYYLMGDYKNALPLYVEALQNTEKSLGKKHLSYSVRLNNLGLLYSVTKDFDKAMTLYLEALKIIENVAGKNSPDYVTTLNNLADIYRIKGENSKALSLHLESLQITGSISGKENNRYISSLYNVARTYQASGNYTKAVDLFLDSLEKVKSFGKEQSPFYNPILFNLAKSYYGNKDYEKSLVYTLESNQNLILKTEKIFSFRSEQEKKAFLETILSEFSFSQSFGINKKTQLDELTEMNLNNQLIMKGLLLNTSKDILKNLMALNIPAVNEKINSFRSLKSKLAFQLSQSSKNQTQNIDSTSSAVNSYEIELIKEYNSRFPNSNKLKKDWREIQGKLKPDEVAIEFSHFQYTNRKEITDSIYYAAYLIKKEWNHPKMVYLFEKKQLTNLLNKKTPDQLYSSRGSSGTNTANGIIYRDSIYSLVWQPLEQYVAEAKTIYFSPDGLLYQLPFSALAQKEGRILSQQYDLFQLSSTSTISNPKKIPRMDSTLLIGGIDYDFNPLSTIKVKENPISYIDIERRGGRKANRSSGETWDYLPGTKRETDSIKLIYDSKGMTYQLLSGASATEENFKKIIGKSPAILHIATHGFFFENSSIKKPSVLENPTKNQYKLAEDPLLRSGLILAGANYAWKNGTNPYANEDAILTALEISNLDLSNTDIVVLSACETGLGDMDSSEGVYGLQRAFKMAGVHYIVMSLWQVPDAETAEFMKLFYSNWLGGNQVRTAFNTAQKTMQLKYADEPQKWAAFVLFE